MIPERGSYVMDGRDGRIGLVMGHEGPYVQLRPPGGGKEWDCPPYALRAAPPTALLTARIKELNWESRMP